MNKPDDNILAPAETLITDCWNRIGVRGDLSCPELEKHIHCRNCPVYSAAAANMLDIELPSGHLTAWTHQLAQKRKSVEFGVKSAIVFRIGAEWLALPTEIFREIVGGRTIHSVPHRRNGMVLGLVNIRGELTVCISLPQILGLSEPAGRQTEKHRATETRLLVIQRDGGRAVCPVDEVAGVQRFNPQEQLALPATFAMAATTYTKAVLSWDSKPIALLDDQLIFYTLNRSLGLATSI